MSPSTENAASARNAGPSRCKDYVRRWIGDRRKLSAVSSTLARLYAVIRHHFSHPYQQPALAYERVSCMGNENIVQKHYVATLPTKAGFKSLIDIPKVVKHSIFNPRAISEKAIPRKGLVRKHRQKRFADFGIQTGTMPMQRLIEPRHFSAIGMCDGRWAHTASLQDSRAPPPVLQTRIPARLFNLVLRRRPEDSPPI